MMNIGLEVDNQTAQVVPMFVKKTDDGYAFFNWTKVRMVDDKLALSGLGQIKLAALASIHTGDEDKPVFTHHTFANCKRSISEELEVLIDKLPTGAKVLFCVDAETEDEASAEFYKAIGYVVGDPDSVVAAPIHYSECGITRVSDPFVVVRISNTH